MKRLFMIIATSFISGCVTIGQPVQLKESFSPFEHMPYSGDGYSTIAGHAILRQVGGSVVTCAGNEVIAIPNTAYAKELISIVKRGLTPVNSNGVRPIMPPMKITACDASGNFTLTKMRPGSWLVVTDVSWFVGITKHGGALMQAVQVIDSETTRISLGQRDFVSK